MRPSSGGSRRVTQRNKVDFPAPLGPMRATSSPARSSIETRSSATAIGNRFDTSFNRNTIGRSAATASLLTIRNVCKGLDKLAPQPGRELIDGRHHDQHDHRQCEELGKIEKIDRRLDLNADAAGSHNAKNGGGPH